MSELVLIKNPRQCPNCARTHSIRRDLRKCGECGTRLFYPEDNFPLIHRELSFSYWVHFPVGNPGTFRGWVHACHLDKPNPNEGPMDLTKPGKDYGKRSPLGDNTSASHTTQELGASALTGTN